MQTSSAPLRLARLDLLTVDLPQKETFRSGIGVRRSRRALIVRWTDPDGEVGYGECSCRPDPFYSAEFLAAARQLIARFIAPALHTEMTLGELMSVLDRIRGWQFTRAAVEAAALDLLERTVGYTRLDEWEVEPLAAVPVGISIGLHPDAEALRKTVEAARTDGYRRLKFKISPELDAAQFDFLAEIPQLPPLAFDANGSFSRETLDRLAPYLRWGAVFEQPFAPGDIQAVRKAKDRFGSDFRICFDEEIKHLGDWIKLHELGLADELNLKPGRVGGLRNAIEIAQYCAQHNLPCWVGGMFETGIGRAANLRVAARLPDATAHDLSPSRRYFVRDLVDEPLRMQPEGTILTQDAQKVTVKSEILAGFTTESQCIFPVEM